MDRREWIYQADDGVGLSVALNLDDNETSVTLRAGTSSNIEVTLNGKQSVCDITLESEQLDALAVAWIKHRGLKHRLNKYSLDELLAKCEAAEDAADDIYLAELVREREGQDEVEVELVFDNIFDVVSEDASESERLKAISDFLLRFREMRDELKHAFPILTNIKDGKEHALALQFMEVLIEDYDSNSIFIDSLSWAIKRYEDENLD